MSVRSLAAKSVVTLVIVLVAACGGAESSTTPGAETAPPARLANPASVHCVDKGYELEMREEAGGTAGYCIFADGSECEEWAYFRGECKPGDIKPGE